MSEDTKTHLLDVAQRLVQTRGFNGFAYQDLAREVGISTASIHYHFPSKTDLGIALIRRYAEAVRANLSEAIARPTLASALDLASGLYIASLRDGARVCLGGALAGEFATLPVGLRRELRRLIGDCVEGFTALLRAARDRGELSRRCDVAGLARLWYGALQGGLLLARAEEAAGLESTIGTLKKLTMAA